MRVIKEIIKMTIENMILIEMKIKVGIRIKIYAPAVVWDVTIENECAARLEDSNYYCH